MKPASALGEGWLEKRCLWGQGDREREAGFRLDLEQESKEPPLGRDPHLHVVRGAWSTWPAQETAGVREAPLVWLLELETKLRGRH